MKKIVVTGGSGKAGKACVADLLEHGYRVFIVDQVLPEEKRAGRTLADLTDYGQTVDAISTVDGGPHSVHAVVHLAAIPAPRLFANAYTFHNNTVADYNVFEACRRLGIKNIVWASSQTVLGYPFDSPPAYVPMDEESPPRPQSVYALSKLLAETMAQQFCRWDPELKMIGLRLCNVTVLDAYAKYPSFQEEPKLKRQDFWAYIDARDAAQAIRKAIEAPIKGAEIFNIANADTVMDRPTEELLKEFFPNVPIKRAISKYETLISIEKAKRMLGFEPQYTWRTMV